MMAGGNQWMNSPPFLILDGLSWVLFIIKPLARGSHRPSNQMLLASCGQFRNSPSYWLSCLPCLTSLPFSLFFFFLKLFIWLCLSWGTQDFHCIMRDLSLQCVDFVVSESRLSCWVASGILVPQPGIKPTSLASQGGFLTTGPTRKSLIFKSLLNLLQYYFCFMFWPRGMWYLTIHTPCIARRILFFFLISLPFFFF